MAPYHAKKRLGQNFLVSDAIISKVIDLTNVDPSETVVEVGPGRGALTLSLAKSGAKVIAVEFDRDLMGYLEKLLGDYGNAVLINEDFLKFEPPAQPFVLVGNLPYNIATPVFEWAVSHRENLRRAVLMVQKEVAERLASSPGSKDWSPLAIFTQLHFDIAAHFDVSPRHFSPSPKVTSTVIELRPRQAMEIRYRGAFETLVRAAFGRRRKTLLNNLVAELGLEKQTAQEIFGQLSLSERCRAEETATAKFLELTNILVERNILTA